MNLRDRLAFGFGARKHRVLPPGNILRCLASLLVVGLFPRATGALDQAVPPSPAGSTALVASPGEAPLVDWGSAQRAFFEVERWVRAGATHAGAEPIWVRGVGGVRVTLRWLGRPMGTGDTLVPPYEQALPVDLLAVARVATGAAFANVQASIDARNFRARSGGEGAATRPWTLADLQPLQVDLQVALPVEPVLVTDAEPDAILSTFAPGFHGLVLTRVEGEQAREARTWPATALAANTPILSQFVQPLADLGYPATAVEQLLRQVGRSPSLRLGRFEVIHLVRMGEGQPVERLVRGNVVLPPVSVTGATLTGMADRLVNHLLMRQTEDGSFLGTYLPTSDRYEPQQATLPEAALAAYALARHAAYALAGQEEAALKENLLVQAHERSLRYLVKQMLAAESAGEPSAVALTLLAVVHGPGAGQRKVEREALTQQLLAAQDAQGYFSAGAEPKPGSGAQALAAAALAAVYRQTHDATLLARIERARQTLHTSLGDELDVAALPWLGDLEDVLRDGRAAATANRPAAVTQPQTSGNDDPLWVREGWAQRLRARQVRVPPSIGPLDVTGGYDLQHTGRPFPTPDWRSGQVLCFMAHELKVRPPADRRERMLQVLDAGLAARFLAQLMFDHPSSFYVRSPQDVLGGVRTALWDNRLPTASTATGLLAVVELQEALAGLNEPLSQN